MTKTINIQVKMEERWISYFLSFLKNMEHYGNIGHSGLLGFYADGDGDFRPKFTADTPFNSVKSVKREELIKRHEDDYHKEHINPTLVPECYYDAG